MHVLGYRPTVTILGLFLALAVGTSTAQAAKGVKKNVSGKGVKKNVSGSPIALAAHKVHGTVVAVDHNKGTLTVKLHNHHKKILTTTTTLTTLKPTATGKSHKHAFHVVSGVKVTAVHGKSSKPASLSAIHKGERVAMLVIGDTVEAITIHSHKKKKKK